MNFSKSTQDQGKEPVAKTDEVGAKVEAAPAPLPTGKAISNLGSDLKAVFTDGGASRQVEIRVRLLNEKQVAVFEITAEGKSIKRGVYEL